MFSTRFIFFLIPFSQKVLGTRIWVDDTDVRIVYTGNWTFSSDSGRHNNGLYNGSETWSDQPGATATFQFRGTSIEYWGTQGYLHGPCKIEVDGNDHDFVDSWALTDGPTVQLFKYTQDLENKLVQRNSHTLSISVPITPPNPPTVSGQTDKKRCEIDYFIYSTVDQLAPRSDSSSNPDDDIGTTRVVVPCVLIIVAFLVIFWWCYRKHRRSPTIRPRPTGRLPRTPILPATHPIQLPILARMNHSPSQARRSQSNIRPHSNAPNSSVSAAMDSSPSRFRIIRPQTASDPNCSAVADILPTPLNPQPPDSDTVVVNPFPPDTIKNDAMSQHERNGATEEPTSRAGIE